MNASEIIVNVSGTQFPVKVYTNTADDRGWVLGRIVVRNADYQYSSSYDFGAKVYDTPSKYGINEGRVSKLYVKDINSYIPTEVIGYDREWYLEPHCPQEMAALGAILTIFDTPSVQ